MPEEQINTDGIFVLTDDTGMLNTLHVYLSDIEYQLLCLLLNVILFLKLQNVLLSHPEKHLDINKPQRIKLGG